jgi:hypothetical protein
MGYRARVWIEAFRQVSGQWAHETRGQTWDDVDVTGDSKAIVVTGMEDHTDRDALRNYLDGLVEAANTDAAREDASAERGEDEETEQARRKVEAASRLADELREPPQ